MADEPGTLGGRTPGPGSARGGAASAAAASRIRVDTSDVTKLKTAIKQTQVEAKALSDTLGAFDSKVLPTIRKVRAELEGLQRALGTSGTRSATGPKATPIGGGVGSANQHAGQMSGGAVNVGRGGSYLPGTAGSAYSSTLIGGGPQPAGPTFLGMPGPTQYNPQTPGPFNRARSYLFTPAPTGTGSSFKPPAWTTTPAFRGAMGALGAAASVGSLAAGHLDDATSRSYLINTTQLLTGGSTGNRAQFRFNQGLTAAMGNTGLGYGDVTSALGTLATTGVMGGSYGASRMASVGFLSNINPMQGNAASAQQIGQTFTSQNYYRMRLAGVNASIANGQNIQQVFDGIIRRIEQASGHPLTSEEIQSGLQQGTHLNADLTAMGLSQDMIQQIVQYWAARRATGKTGVAAVRGSGAQNNLAYQRQRAGAAKSRALGNIDTGYIPGASQASRALGHEYNALGAAADTPVGHALSDAAGNLAVFSDQLKKATNVIKTIVEWEIASRLLGGGKGLPRLPGSRTPGTPRAGGGRGVVGKVVTGLAVLDFAHHASQSTPKVSKNNWGWDRWTAPAKGAWGGVKGVIDDLNPFGGSGQDPSIWGGSGQTFKTLEQMASGGPHEIVTSTTGGQHAQGSYHYKGQAIDLADKVGSHDSPGLLAINRYLAQKYGHKLAELIYAGPGGINIKNGKVVNGMATYGAATMAEHHNHVHVAATPGSLGMSGGVDVGNGDPAQSAASSGGFARPGGPSGGPSVNNASSALGSIFTTSSSAALMAALTGQFAGGASALTSGRSGGSSPRTAAAGAGRVPAAPGNSKGNVALAKRMAASRGWTGKEWDALYAVWNQESGFRTNAGSLGAAYGIPQALPGSKMASAGPDWQTNPSTQIKWGLNYIGGRYHDPLGALAHKHATDSRLGSHAPMAQPGGWYAKGQFEIFRDELARLHKGEMVIPAQEAAQIRSIVGSARSTGGTSSGGGRRTVPVQLVFQVTGGGEAEARKHASQFAQFVAEDHDIDMVAST